jgi:uncharacterized membrane protein
MRTRSLRELVYFGAGLGLIASVYAAAEVQDASLSKACTFSAFFSCGKILGSGKTTLLGIPDWSVGIAGFILILVVGVMAERYRKDPRVTYALLGVTSLGVALAAYFLYVELAEIGGLCPVCVTAYFFGVLAWLGAVGLARKAYRRAHRAPEPSPAPG